MGVDGLGPLLREAQVARLATIGEDGRPHLVPFCFALEAGKIVSVVDAKPKRSPDLQRIRNIEANPFVEVLVDHYEADWRKIWWVRVRGQARVIVSGAERETAVDRLVEKYEQYRAERPAGAVISIRPDRWSSWSGDGLISNRSVKLD